MSAKRHRSGAMISTWRNMPNKNNAIFKEIEDRWGMAPRPGASRFENVSVHDIPFLLAHVYRLEETLRAIEVLARRGIYDEYGVWGDCEGNTNYSQILNLTQTKENT